jgi:flagellar hook-associated protein FlgK
MSARAKLMTDWKTFLQQSVETRKSYTMMFQPQEKPLQNNLVAAQEGLAQAKKSFEEQSDALRESGIQDISDEDKENANTEEVMEYETTKRIHEGLSTVVSSLQELTDRAEIEEQQAKRQRRAVVAPDEDAGDATSLSSFPSMQPFGTPGVK